VQENTMSQPRTNQRGAPRQSETADPGDAPPPPRYEGPKLVDIELTNACNTACTFCPRDKTPRQGLMKESTFEKALERIAELNNVPKVPLCGLGEPLLHPRVVDFIRRLASRNVPNAITTNASRLTKEMSEKLISAGLNELTVSASGFGPLYEEIHKLPFDVVKRNIAGFLDAAGRQEEKDRCEVVIQIVVTHQNRRRIGEIKSYWQDVGVKQFNFFNETNRGGSLDAGRVFRQSEKFRGRAQSLLAEHHIDPLCGAPFHFVFIGFNGNYYMCCHDYAKRHPLGTVFDLGIHEINAIKKRFLLDAFPVCSTCNLDQANVLRKTLAKIELGLSPPEELQQELEELKIRTARFPVTAIDFGEKEDRRECA